MKRVRLLALSVMIVGVIWVAVAYGVQTAVDRAVMRDAIDKAENWGGYMASRLTDVRDLSLTGKPNTDQIETIAEIRSLGDIFRFKLFSASGRLALVSDDAHMDGYAGISDEVDIEPLMVAQTGRAIVEVYDGTEKPNRPDLYAEAYIPLLGPDGQVEAVVEVYVDQTKTSQYFRESFQTFGILLAGFCALIFLGPAIAFFIQRGVAQKSRQDADFLARFDPLTGLMNRREFYEQASLAQNTADHLSYLCCLDVDNFKMLNDTHGDAAGDAFLSHIADIIRNAGRACDFAARFDGDEFVLGFKKISKDAAIRRVKEILKECREDFQFEDKVLCGSMSIGIAEIDQGTPLEDVVKNADAALYYAKTSGRNTFAIYGSEMGAEIERRRALEARLLEATRNKDFEVHYQPLICSENKTVIGYEALLRLPKADGNYISPTDFIPLAEELGLIEEIGQWTIKTAIKEIAAASDEAKVAINLSSVQFESGNLCELLRHTLEETQFPAARLELEITESLLLEDTSFIEMQIDALKEMGIKIAMDDFGTGYSSLSYLWKYGFDRLKIDRSFVLALDKSPERSREIIEAIILLGAKLNMNITAEGVETSEQSELLTELGCDTLQGFLYGRPAPVRNLQRHVNLGSDVANQRMI